MTLNEDHITQDEAFQKIFKFVIDDVHYFIPVAKFCCFNNSFTVFNKLLLNKIYEF